MIGILVELIVSWLLLYLLTRRHITALGFTPVTKRLAQFTMGFLVTTFLCAMVQLLEAYLQSSSWIMNEDITSTQVLRSLWWDVKSVLTEELLFRGALLYILIRKIGAPKSILISAAAFGVYHWFSYGVFGNVMAMIFVFIGTGLMGYAWAWAFAKTKSILLPFGLHLGWNFCYNTIFSNGPLGDSLLVSSGGHELTDWVSLLNFLSGLVIAPVFVLLYVRFFVREETNE